MSGERDDTSAVGGRTCRHEMIYDDERKRSYANELTDFLKDLIPGYDLLADPGERASARIRHAAGVRASWQANVNAAFGTVGCTPEQISVLTSDQPFPLVPCTWSAPVPLLLLDSCYEPTTELPRPIAEEPGEIFWLEPAEELTYLSSLNVLDVVMLVDHAAESHYAGWASEAVPRAHVTGQ